MATGLIFGLGLGLGAVKLVPSFKLLRDFPRYAGAEGGWLARGKRVSNLPEKLGDNTLQPPMQRKTPVPAKWELPAMLTKAFLGRDQRAHQFYFYNQGFAWQEYGTYLGPFTVLLLCCFPLAIRSQWPWLASAMICFLLAAGHFRILPPGPSFIACPF